MEVLDFKPIRKSGPFTSLSALIQLSFLYHLYFLQYLFITPLITGGINLIEGSISYSHICGPYGLNRTWYQPWCRFCGSYCMLWPEACIALWPEAGIARLATSQTFQFCILVPQTSQSTSRGTKTNQVD